MPDEKPARRQQISGNRLWVIQLLRGAAALMIVVGHSQTAIGRLAAGRAETFHRWQPLPWGGSLDLFFVISGFIMVHASRRLFGCPGARREFLSRRIARVVPLYWCCTTALLAILTLAMLKGGAPLPAASHVIGSYLFVPVSSPDGNIFPVLDLGWTLNYEMAFYALFALAIGFSRHRAIAIVLAALLAFICIGMAVPLSAVSLSFWTRPIILDFGLGVVVGALFARGVALPSAIRWLAIAIGVLLFATDPFGIFRVPLGATVANEMPRVFAAGMPSALVMSGALLGREPALPRWLDPAMAVGNASYSLYLTHPFVLIVMEKLFEKSDLFQRMPLPVLVALTVLAALAMSLVSFRFIERPLTAAADRMLGDRHANRKARHSDISQKGCLL